MVDKMSSPPTYPFEKLRVWQESMFWLGGLYEITRKFHEFVEYGQMSRPFQANLPRVQEVLQKKIRLTTRTLLMLQ